MQLKNSAVKPYEEFSNTFSNPFWKISMAEIYDEFSEYSLLWTLRNFWKCLFLPFLRWLLLHIFGPLDSFGADLPQS